MEKTRRIELWDHFLFEMSLSGHFALFFSAKITFANRRRTPVSNRTRDSPHVEKILKFVGLIWSWQFNLLIFFLGGNLLTTQNSGSQWVTNPFISIEGRQFFNLLELRCTSYIQLDFFFGSSLGMTAVSATLESLEGKKRVIELLSTFVPSDVINVFLAR